MTTTRKTTTMMTTTTTTILWDEEFAPFLTMTDKLIFIPANVSARIQCFNSVLLQDSFCIDYLDQ